tara:strand:- start:40 stop:1194 length:1155 start_codon:yes stop_codon:yes gene_type:complete
MIDSTFSNSQLISNINDGVTDSSKKYVRALVVLSSSKNSAATYESKNSTGDVVYSGFTYSLWKRIKESLSANYEFKEEFKKISDYDDVINNVYNDKYDIVVGLFYRTPKRLNRVNFSSPIILTQNSVLTYDKINYIQRLFITMKDLLIGPMILLLVLSVIFGFLLHKSEPTRSSYIDQVTKSKIKPKNFKLGLRRSIMTTIAAFFGEMGFLTENTTLGYKGLFVVVFIMIVAFVFVLVLQAQATTFDAELQKRGVITRGNMKNKHFLCLKGSAAARKFERLGAKITYSSKMNFEQLLEYYEKNKDTYNGVTVDSMTGTRYKTSKLNLESDDFGLQMMAFPINKNNIDLLRDVDKEVLKLQETLEQEKICKGFFEGDDSEHLCAV